MTRWMLTMAITAVCCMTALSQDQWKDVYTESAWSSRDRWQRADELIRRLHIKSGSLVADLGCHEGYMTFKLSPVVGPKGRVYAVDLDPHRLDKLKNHRDMNQITNISIIHGDPDDPKLPDKQLDAVLILDTYHEMREHDTILQHVKNALKPGGRLVICEPIADQRRKYARADQEAKHEVGMDFVKNDLENMDFKVLNSQDPFVDRIREKGDQMWLIVAVRK